MSMCENMGLNPIGRTEQLVEQNGAACGANRVRFIVGGYHAGFSLLRHGFESRNRKQEKSFSEGYSLCEQVLVWFRRL